MGGAILASLVLVSCGGSSDSSDVERFTFQTINGDVVERDSQTKLGWVGSDGSGPVKACKGYPQADSAPGAVASANDHCFSLNFAGFNDWRAPTVAEQKEMLVQMRNEGKTPFYTVPECPRLIGIDGATPTAINTHNSDPVGALTTWPALLDLPKPNYGLKCVRNF